MPKNLNITIPQPCHENWNSMNPAEQGRHCSSCNKVVVDFTCMTDAQLVEYFSATRQKTCGRFGTDQLDRRIRLRPVEKPLFPYKYLAASLLATGVWWQGAHANDLADTALRPIVQTRLCADDTPVTQSAAIDTCEVEETDTPGEDTMRMVGELVVYTAPVKEEVLYPISLTGDVAITLGFCTMPVVPENEFDSLKLADFKPAPYRIPYFGPVLEKLNNALSKKPRGKQPGDKAYRFSLATIVNRLRIKRRGE
jgi:hypothetical protein